MSSATRQIERPDGDMAHARHSAPRSWRAWIAPALVAAACLAAYSNSLEGEMIFDDGPAIQHNPSIRSLWPLWPVLRTQPRTTTEGRPVLNLSLAVNYAFSGTDVWGYHATNVAIHLAASLALLGVARRTLRWPSIPADLRAHADGLGLTIALLWSLHPMQTESVTYIVQRAESLAGMLHLLVLYTMIRGAQCDAEWPRSTARAWYAASVAACFLLMGAKEVVGISAPVIVLIYDRVFVSRSWSEVFAARKGYYAALASTWCVLAAVLTLAGGWSGSGGLGQGMDSWDYFRTQWWAIVRYLRLAVWPDDLTLDYGTELARPGVWITVRGVALTALGVATFAAYWRAPKLAWLGTVFFLLLGPTSSFIPVVTQTIAEHRMYLAMTAVVSFVVLAARRVWTWLIPRTAHDSAAVRLAPAVCVGVVAATLGCLTYARNEDYRTAMSIWQDTVAKHPTNSRAFVNVGVAASDRGDYPLSVAALTKALEIRQRNVDAMARFVGPEQAAKLLQTEVRENYTATLVHRAFSYFRLGRNTEALADLDRAIELNPDFGRAYNIRGSVYQSLGEREKALADYQRAVSLAPDNADAQSNLGAALVENSRPAEAIEPLSEAVRLNPQLALAYQNRGNAYWKTGELELAAKDFTRAIELAPQEAQLRLNRGTVYRFMGRNDLAIDDFTHVIQSQPNVAPAYFARAGAYFDVGRLDLARVDIAVFQRLGGQPPAEFLRLLQAN